MEQEFNNTKRSNFNILFRSVQTSQSTSKERMMRKDPNKSIDFSDYNLSMRTIKANQEVMKNIK